MNNIFQCLNLKWMFYFQVMVVTTHEGVPEEFYGAKLIGSWRSVVVSCWPVAEFCNAAIIIFSVLSYWSFMQLNK